MNNVVSVFMRMCHVKLPPISHREKFNIDILAKKKFRSQYTCEEARKKFGDKKSMLNFSRQAHNGKVTDCHTLLEFFNFLSRAVFWAGILI